MEHVQKTPGGKLEYLEAIEEAARREGREETGVEIEHLRFQFVANLTEYAPRYFLHVGAHRRLEIRRGAVA